MRETAKATKWGGHLRFNENLGGVLAELLMLNEEAVIAILLKNGQFTLLKRSLTLLSKKSKQVQISTFLFQ